MNILYNYNCCKITIHCKYLGYKDYQKALYSNYVLVSKNILFNLNFTGCSYETNFDIFHLCINIEVNKDSEILDY